MKIVSIGKSLINLDKVIYVDVEMQIVFLEDKHEIRLNENELEEFIFNYNLYDTDEVKFLLTRIGRIIASNPDYLTKEGIQEQITISVRWHKQEEYLKEITEGVKLKDLPLPKLLTVYKLIQEKVKEIEKDNPF